MCRVQLIACVIYSILLGISRCDDVTNVTEGQGPCRTLVGCVKLGVTKRLNDIENSQVYPLIGKHLVLEKTSEASTKDNNKLGIIQRTNRILDNHVVRARLGKSYSLTLFRTPKGNFDVAFEIGEPATAGDGRTFFKRRLQMALLPIMYKLGVITTLMGGLVIMVMKGLVIGVILLILAVASAVKHKVHWHQPEHHGGWSAPGAVPYAHHTQPQDIHVHLHGIQKEPYVHKEYGVPSGSAHITAGGGDSYLSPYNRAAHLNTA